MTVNETVSNVHEPGRWPARPLSVVKASCLLELFITTTNVGLVWSILLKHSTILALHKSQIQTSQATTKP